MCVDVDAGKLIGEFKGKNTLRVLPDGRLETTGQGTGKILGVNATMLFTDVSTIIPNRVFMGEANGQIWTINGDIVTVKIISISWSTGRGNYAERIFPDDSVAEAHAPEQDNRHA